jgi:hypothetical protein
MSGDSIANVCVSAGQYTMSGDSIANVCVSAGQYTMSGDSRLLFRSVSG